MTTRVAPPVCPNRNLINMYRFSALAMVAALAAAPVSADGVEERVTGYFCNDMKETVAFLTLQAQGENEIMAANGVNKSVAAMSCAPYLPTAAVQTGEKTVMEGGLVFKVQKYLFLPEKVERWNGTVFGSLQTTGSLNQDI